VHRACGHDGHRLGTLHRGRFECLSVGAEAHERVPPTTVTEAIAASSGSGPRAAVTITCSTLERSSANARSDKPAESSAASNEYSPANSCTRSTRDEVDMKRQGKGRQSKDLRYRTWSVIAQPSRPTPHLGPSHPSGCRGRSPGLRVDLSLRPHVPVLVHAQWSNAVSALAYRCVGSAGIASAKRMRTGFPFHPKEALHCPWDT
jgi:hypothetical protein